MNDFKIISLLDETHPAELGRGGFKISLTHTCGLLYDEEERMILDNLELKYVKPLGPFKKWVEITADVKTKENNYWLFYKDEFWPVISEDDAKERYLVPFLTVLRLFSTDKIDESDTRNHLLGSKVIARKDSLSEEDTQYFSSWIEQIKKYNPTIYGRK